MPKRFKFKLETALWHRQLIEDEKKRDFGLAQRDTLTAIRQKEIIEEERARYQQELLNKHKEEHIDPNYIMATHTYIYHLNLALTAAEANIAKLKEIEEEKRAALVEATKRKKALERLREKKLKDYMYELDREEQKFLDDIAQSRYAERLAAEQQ